MVLAGGEVAELGTHQELVEQGGVYAGMWSQQALGEEKAPVRRRAKEVVEDSFRGGRGRGRKGGGGGRGGGMGGMGL